MWINCMSIFFFNDTATTEIYTLSLHDALPIFREADLFVLPAKQAASGDRDGLPNVLMEAASQQLAIAASDFGGIPEFVRSEEHTSELQSRQYLVCRLLLEKKKLTASSCAYVSR